MDGRKGGETEEMSLALEGNASFTHLLMAGAEKTPE